MRITRNTNRRGRGQRGQSMVELALVVPVFLIILLGIMDFGLALRSWVTITNAAREGARLGIVGADCTAITDRAVDTSGGLLTVGDVTVQNCQGSPGDSVTVTVDYQYDFITPLPQIANTLTGGALPNAIDMTSSSDMRIE